MCDFSILTTSGMQAFFFSNCPCSCLADGAFAQQFYTAGGRSRLGSHRMCLPWVQLQAGSPRPHSQIETFLDPLWGLADPGDLRLHGCRKILRISSTNHLRNHCQPLCVSNCRTLNLKPRSRAPSKPDFVANVKNKSRNMAAHTSFAPSKRQPQTVVKDSKDIHRRNRCTSLTGCTVLGKSPRFEMELENAEFDPNTHVISSFEYQLHQHSSSCSAHHHSM